MTSTDFSSLPWFIRKDIILKVIFFNKEYCLVGREWLHATLGQYSKLQFDYSPVSKAISKFLVTEHSEVIEFNRTDRIDWNIVYAKKQTRKIMLSLYNRGVDLEFLENLSKMSQLKSLFIMGRGDFSYIPRVLEHYTKSLKVLYLYQSRKDCSNLIQGIVLTSLVSLRLSVSLGLLSLESLLNNLPSLKRLDLYIYDSSPYRILSNDLVVSNVTHLSLVLETNQPTPVQLDISRFPHVEKLMLSGPFELIDIKPCSIIRDLNLTGYLGDVTDILFPTFCNIEKLYLRLPVDEKGCFKLLNVLKTLPKLSYLGLFVCQRYPHLIIPTIPFKLTTLRIGGHNPISPYLDWAISSFNPEKLELSIHTDIPPSPKVVLFNTLRHVIISCQNPDYHQWYKEYFSKEVFPQLEPPTILENCEVCEFNDMLW